MRFFEEKVTKLQRAITACLLSSIIRSADISPTPVTTKLSTFTPTSQPKVASLIDAAPSKTSPLDILPTPIMKLSCDELSVVIAGVANRSFERSEFLASMKVDLVRPLIKKHGLITNEFKNIRPITSLSATLEDSRLVMCPLRPHVTSSPNYCLLHSAYRSGQF